MPIKSAGTYMQISDLCKSCSKQNFCGNGITNHYCTGYAPITYQYHTDIKIQPFDADVELDKLDNESMTNEEWFTGLSTEEKAKFLAIQIRLGVAFYRTNDERYQNPAWWVKWLKKPYSEVALCCKESEVAE